jgi:hypothetical protein
MNPFTIKPVEPFTVKKVEPFKLQQVAGPNLSPSKVTGPNPVAEIPMGPTPLIGPTPVAQQSMTPSLYTNGITSDPTEIAKNKANLAASISNLQAQTPIGFNLSQPGSSNQFDSTAINTGTTRDDVLSKLAAKQAELAAGTNPNLKATSGYQKFLQDYSSKVAYSPEQQAAYKGMNETASQIADIQRNLQNRQLQLSREGGLSPQQVAADMRQYQAEAASKIADLQSSQRDYTLSFNALEAARKNTLDAFQVQAPFYKPVEISPGSQIIDPTTGQQITQGTGVAPSTAISYANQLYQNDLTSGQPKLDQFGQVDSAYYFQQAQQQLGGQGQGFNVGQSQFGGQPAELQVPPSIQSATSYIGNDAYIDAGGLNANQLPIAQAYSARTGVPLLPEKDATKLKEASAIFKTADTLVNTLEKNGKAVFTAQSALGLPVQYASIKLGSLLRTDPNAQIFEQTRSAFLAQLAKAAGEKGVLTDPDIERIRSATPNATDTIESAGLKIQQLRGIYEDVKNGAVSAYLGSKQPTAPKGDSVVQTKAGAINTNW